MPTSGSGTGQAITTIPCTPPTSWTVDDLPDCRAVSMARYAAILNYYECSFWGVRRDDTPKSCRTIWIKYERDTIARQLVESQEEVEQQVGYPLCRRWFEEQHPYTFPLTADWGQVVSGGVPALAAIAENTPVNHATDPAVVGPIGTTVTDASEIHVYYPAAVDSSEMIEITPSRVVLSGGAVRIEIPRCRMVRVDHMDNDRNGLDYTDLTNFLASVDVMRVYNDPSTHATLAWPNQSSGSCSPGCNCPVCSSYTMDGCINVRDGQLGILGVLPAAYSGGSWSVTNQSSCCIGRPNYATIHYLAGLGRVTYQAEDAVIRLAHSKMPDEPCTCELVSLVWKRDRHVPDVLTASRINCRFGLSDGAWTAWQFTQALKLVRGGRPL